MIHNLAASVHQRLLNHAKAKDRPFNETLQYFALERFLYRLGCSPYRDQFVLKGALMFTVWQTPFIRSTRDIDMLGQLDNTVEYVVNAVREICQQTVVEDGLSFDTETITGEQIVKSADYHGVRVKFKAYLDTARIPMQIDIGFGDVVLPEPSAIQMPTILDFPPPELQGYTRESIVAEKLHIMVSLGIINSRMKDYFDIWLLATHCTFTGFTLTQAIQVTFRQRKTEIPKSPVGLSESFTRDAKKQKQWKAFLRRHRLESEMGIPISLDLTVQVINAFLQPVLLALVEERPFEQIWEPGGPWISLHSD